MRSPGIWPQEPASIVILACVLLVALTFCLPWASVTAEAAIDNGSTIDNGSMIYDGTVADNGSAIVDGDIADDAGEDPPPSVIVQGYVYKCIFVAGKRIPIAGATVFLVNNTDNTSVSFAATDPTGYYSMAIYPGPYTRIVSAPGFETLIDQVDYPVTRTDDILLFPVPFNGFVPYALYPVLETSPGRDVVCIICVDNLQVIDQLATVTVVTPEGWEAWFPQGEAVMVRTGCSAPLGFVLRYEGNMQGPHQMKVVVNGGSYSAEIPIIVVVKDLPYETLDLFANSYYQSVQPGTTAWYKLTIVNNFATDKRLKTMVVSPWNFATENNEMISNTNEEYMVYKNSKYEYWLRVFVPLGTPCGDYLIPLWMYGEGVRSNDLYLTLHVDTTPYLILAFYNETSGPIQYCYNCSPKGTLTFIVQVTNLWGFPVTVQPSAWVEDKNSTAWQSTFYSTNCKNDQEAFLYPYNTTNITFTVKPPDSVVKGDYTMKFHIVAKDPETGEHVYSLEPTAMIHITNGAGDSGQLSFGIGNLPDLHDVLLAAVAGLFLLSIILPALRQHWKK